MTTLVAGVALIATLAAFAQALSGFGFALVAVPLVTLLTGPQTAVTVVTALGCLLALAMGVQERRHVVGRTVALVTGAGLAGMPVGLLAVTAMSARSLSVFIACVVLAFAFVLARGATVRRGAGPAAAAGFVSGALLTSTGMNGPPLVAGFQAMGLEPREFRATLQVAFCACDALALLGFLAVGRLTADSLLLTAAGLPGMVVGWWLGDRLFARTDPRRFKKIVLAVLVASACMALAQAAFG
ncbi:sulfite exporter TauE/SafE family protein [Nonomuraea mesophila]|uniref:Probable membrane transporter protein n=1 Tax=Nonomuraea mesophila TaxID=2530382 RepID=A0A4R5FXH7_9ACTN|nr:sulfite exporter TauE/SafE family protein [Nonomuraea mesophila]TDE59725.1 sulfite exporter TauE/SafE family protein [Nonomuraea mesophila]